MSKAMQERMNKAKVPGMNVLSRRLGVWVADSWPILMVLVCGMSMRIVSLIEGKDVRV